MKKFIALILVLITVMTSIPMTVSASSVDCEALTVVMSVGDFLEDLFQNLPKFIKSVSENTEKIISAAQKVIENLEEKGLFDITEVVDSKVEDYVVEDELQEEILERIEPNVSTSVEVRSGTYNYKSTYVVYGETVPCHLIHTNSIATAVEILSDVKSDEFLAIEDVEALFLEKFGRRAVVYESERQVKTFLIRDVYSGNEYLIPVKEEGLPIEVWEAFASEFEENFTCECNILDEEGINDFFEERIGYAPMLTVWYRGENDVLFDIEFAHLDGEFYLIEAVYSEEHMAWCLTEEALEKFCERNPECIFVSEQ